jgi:GNAT superfamily N-acetyltransferase
VNISNIKYDIKTASEKEIYSHLVECKNNFCPPLDEKVNIQEYSKKIFDKSVTFEAWIDRFLIGLLAAYLNDMENHAGYITTVSVTKDYMGVGISSKLLNMCIMYAKRYKFKEITLEVGENNLPAFHLYEKFGFTVSRKKDDSIWMIADLANIT